MFAEALSRRLQKTLTKKLNKTKITPEILKEVLHEIKLALLEGDVNYKVVKQIISDLNVKCSNTLYSSEGLNQRQTLIKLLHDEIITVLGKTAPEFSVNSLPTKIILVGLQGSGKTTTVVKLANYISTKFKKSVLLVAADLARPAAIKQLQILAAKVNLDVFASLNESNPLKIVTEALNYAKKNKFEVIIFDTAGRLHVDNDLMTEVFEIQKIVKPQYEFLTIDAQIGQDAVNVVNNFNNKLKLSGVILTKLDSDTRAGAALSITYTTKLPIFFAGTGEQISQFSIFHPDRIADRIMGFGDVKTLLETANENLDQRDVKKTFNRLMQGKFDLKDLLVQLEQIQRMGKFSKVLSMVPGLGKLQSSTEDAEKAETKLNLYRILINSMTYKEMREPRLLKQPSRRERILLGSGRQLKEYNELLSRYDNLKKAVLNWSREIKNGKFTSMPKFT